MNIASVILLLFLFTPGQSFNRKKRIILHSSDDVFQEMQNIRQEIQALKTENSQLKTSIDHLQKASGSVYTRWGRTVCDGNGTEKVYSGYTAGNNYGVAGGAASYLCLPEKPSWAKYVDGLQDEGAYIFGTEYEAYYFHKFEPFPQPMLNQDAPCAVCRSPRPTSIMIPGQTDCYPEWTIEYSGYLMSGYHGHTAATDLRSSWPSDHRNNRELLPIKTNYRMKFDDLR